MAKEVFGHCGKEGRKARGLVRGVDHPDMGYWNAKQHIEGCRNCKARINASIKKGGDTTYEGNGWRDALDAMTPPQRSYGSRNYGSW